MDFEQIAALKEELADRLFNRRGWLWSWHRHVSGIGLGKESDAWYIKVNLEKLPSRNWTPPFTEYKGAPVTFQVVGKIVAH